MLPEKLKAELKPLLIKRAKWNDVLAYNDKPLASYYEIQNRISEIQRKCTHTATEQTGSRKDCLICDKVLETGIKRPSPVICMNQFI